MENSSICFEDIARDMRIIKVKEHDPMNRWHVYEWLKETYMFSGKIPSKRDVVAKFGGIVPSAEIREGIKEFELTVQQQVKPVKFWRGA